jgi:hypothetical protein
MLKGEEKGKRLAHLNRNTELPRKITTKTHKMLQSLRITRRVKTEGIEGIEQLHREAVGEIEEIGDRVSGGRGLVGKELGYGEALAAFLDVGTVTWRLSGREERSGERSIVEEARTSQPREDQSRGHSESTALSG